jgi:hypothetical protein
MWHFLLLIRCRIIVAGLIGAGSALLSLAQQPADSDLLARYCVACHSEQAKTAGIVLEHVNLDKPGDNAELLEKVLRKVRTDEMPPRGLPRPEPTVAKAFTSPLEAALDQAASRNPNPGRPAIHRMNRVEYSNAIRDLLAIDINPGSSLPPDDSGYGFDNIGDVLSVSPLLLERYISLARKISRLAVGDPEILPVVEEYSVPVGLSQADSVSDELPLGSRGGIVIHHDFPLDAEYTFRIRIRGFNNRARDLVHHLDLRLDGARLKEFEILGKSAEADEESPTFDVRVPVKACR